MAYEYNEWKEKLKEAVVTRFRYFLDVLPWGTEFKY